MRFNRLFPNRSMKSGKSWKSGAGLSAIFFLMAAGLCVLISVPGCDRENQVSSPPESAEFRPEMTGEEYLIAVLDEIDEITEYVLRNGRSSAQRMTLDQLNSSLPQREKKMVLSSTNTDTTYVYGEVTDEGYGAVVTEKHAYPKGILLITVRKSYGKPPSSVVSETKKYVSEDDFQNDTTQQSTMTEVYGLSADTIVTHVERNGLLETYTFRLPVITRTTNSQDGTIRVTTRYGNLGSVYSEVRDGDNNLVQVRSSSGAADGGVITYTEYPDSSWRRVRVIGLADGSVFHEITTGSD